MKYVLVLTASFVVGIASALAQTDGLPALEKRVAALESQNKILQQQIDNQQTSISLLNTRIDNLGGIPDDGTATALVGSWTGTVNSVEFRRAVENTGNGLNFENFFFLFPAGSGGNPSGPQPGFSVVQPQNLQPMTVQVNPDMWLARGGSSTSLAFTIGRDGMSLSGSGVANNLPPEPSPSFSLTGVVLSNNFFLLKFRVSTTGPCAPGGILVFQGVGSLNPVDRTRGVITGTGVNENCHHVVFRVGLMKQ